MAKERKLYLREHRRLERETVSFTSILSESVGSKRGMGCQVTLHLGPSNSGKTYRAIETLKKSAMGVYLAPLRLLAWEIADKLNGQKFPCSLLTGEEKAILPGAPYLSSTVEMFNPSLPVDCIVLDESQMVADEQRGWAWMRVLALAQAKQIEIIASLDAEKLISKILSKLGYSFTVIKHLRLQPLTVASKPWSIDRPEEHTIFVAFSRAGVLSLKTYFEKRGWSVTAIYGNLPPEVKRKQAERFINGESKLCVATDAIGMGMNLPAAKVCFTSLTKFDGQSIRALTPAETRQIAGRAGRYKIKEFGQVGALTHEQLRNLKELLDTEPPHLEYARVSPELADIQNMSGPLEMRLTLWEKSNAVPAELRDVVLPSDLDHQKSLASLLKEEEVNRLGFDVVFTLIKAPASRETFPYWWACVQSVLAHRPFPLPSAMERGARSSVDSLLFSENVVEQCDIYLWLSHREELSRFGAEREKVLNYKWGLIEKIDQVLAAKGDHRQKCRRCGNSLPVIHQHTICDDCFRKARHRAFARPKYKKFRF